MDAFSRGAVVLLQAHLTKLCACVDESHELFAAIKVTTSDAMINPYFGSDEDTCTADSCDEENLSTQVF